MSFDFVSTRSEHCPSDLRLDRLVVGELAGAEVTATRGHTAYCLFCRRRLAEIELERRLVAATALPPLRVWAIAPPSWRLWAIPVMAVVATAVLLLAGVLSGCGPAVSRGDDGGDDRDDAGAHDGDNGWVDDLPDMAVYAHTSSTLYRIDPVSLDVSEIGPFRWPGLSDVMTDIAIDKDHVMIGISYGSVYRVNPFDATCLLLSSDLQGMFNGLSFVPAGQVGMPEGPDILVGSRNTDGQIFSIDPMTGAVTSIGDMGGDWVSSGDIVSVHGFGTLATVTTLGALGPDVLARLEPGTFTATPIGSDTGHTDLWGVGFWAGDVFGFSEEGTFVIIDTTTGVATPVETGKPRWWGAAVTTAAPIVD